VLKALDQVVGEELDTLAQFGLQCDKPISLKVGSVINDASLVLPTIGYLSNCCLKFDGD